MTSRSAGPRFEPLSPDVLVRRLATAVDAISPGRVVVGFDGDESVGAADLADRVADALLSLNRPPIRVSTRWWWRAASVRLEYGKQDVESRLSGWVDVGSLRREVLDPLRPDGTGRHLTRLRDPERDRAVRDDYRLAPDNAVLLLDGPLLGTLDLELDLTVRIGVSAGRLARALPENRQWELEAFTDYQRRWPQPPIVISYDHPETPAIRGLS